MTSNIQQTVENGIAEIQQAAKELADTAQSITPASERPATAASLLAEEEIISATSSKRIVPPDVHPEVQTALNKIGKITPNHGFCAEVMCISNALNKGINPRGGLITSVKIGGLNSLRHGIPIPPCPSCQALLNIFNITWIGD